MFSPCQLLPCTRGPATCLDLSHLSLAKVPVSLLQPALEELHLDSNCLVSLPQALASLAGSVFQSDHRFNRPGVAGAVIQTLT